MANSTDQVDETGDQGSVVVADQNTSNVFANLKSEISEICKTIQDSFKPGPWPGPFIRDRLAHTRIRSKAHEAAQHFLELAELSVKEDTRKELVDFLIPLYCSRKEKQRNRRHTSDRDTNLSTRSNIDGQVDRSPNLFEGMLQNSGDCQVQHMKKKRKFQSEECNHEEDPQRLSRKIELWRDVQPNVEKVVIFKKKLACYSVDFKKGARFIVPPEEALLYFLTILDPTKTETVVIEDSQAKRFPIKCKKEQGRYMLRAGWGDIVKTHDLKADDTVVFSVNREYALFIHTEKQHNLPHASDECRNNFQLPDASDNTLADLLIHELLVETGSDEKAESFREMAELLKYKEKREKPFKKLVLEYLSKAHPKSPVKDASEKFGAEVSDHKLINLLIHEILVRMASDTEAESFWEKAELSEEERKKLIYNLLKEFMSTAHPDTDASEERTSFSYQARDDFVRSLWNKHMSKKENVVAVTDASEKRGTEVSETQKNRRQTSELDTKLTTSTNVDGEVDKSEFEDTLQKYAGDDCQVASSKKKS